VGRPSTSNEDKLSRRERRSPHRTVRFSSRDVRSRMAGITTAQRTGVLSGLLVGAQLQYLLFGVKPTSRYFVAKNVTFPAQKGAVRVPASIAAFGAYCPAIAPMPQSSVWHSARFTVSQSRAHAVDSRRLRRRPARIPAGKKMLKISSAVDIRWLLPLAQVWTRSTRHFCRPACSEANRRMRFCSRRGGIPEA